MARTIPDPTEYIPGSSKRPARSRSSRISRQSDRMGHEVRQQRHELRHDRHHAGHRTAATEDVATLLDVGTAVYGEGHSRPAQLHSRPSTAAGENAPRQDIPLDWVRGVERLHRLSQLRAAVETTGSVSAIAAKKKGPQLPAVSPPLARVRLGDVQLLWRICGRKITAMQSDWATIEIDGVQRIIHRRPSEWSSP